MARKKKKRTTKKKPKKIATASAWSEDEDKDLSYDYDDLGDSYNGHDSYGWAPYRTVADRRADAAKLAKKLSKKGEALRPVTASGRKLAKTFWGQAWCKNLEGHHDYENRLPRGRSYLRNGSVIDLQIGSGKISSQVSGSHLYRVDIELTKLQTKKWKKIVSSCTGNVGSVLELLAGKLSDEVMMVITDDRNGLFPDSKEIKMSCTCPDWATMCKHVAATLYGVGVRLDEQPDLFFILRGVDHNELIARSSQNLVKDMDTSKIKFNRKELEGLFGIDISLLG